MSSDAQRQGPTISFSYDIEAETLEDSSDPTGKSSPSTTERPTLDELHRTTGEIGKELASLVSTLQQACVEATTITTASVERYMNACEEVTTVADAHLDCAKRMRVRTMALVSSLPELEEIKGKHDELEIALSKLEESVDVIIGTRGLHV